MVSSPNSRLFVDNSSTDVVELVTTASNWMSPFSYNATNSSGEVVDNRGDVDHCMWFHFVVNTLVIGLLCLFGLLGNTLSLFVLERDRRNRVAVFLLQSLATADNLVLCAAFVELSVVYGLLPVIGRLDMQLASAPYLIKYVNPVGCMVQSCAIWITVLLAVNRYVAVCRPFVATHWLRMRRTRLQVRAARDLYLDRKPGSAMAELSVANWLNRCIIVRRQMDGVGVYEPGTFFFEIY